VISGQGATRERRLDGPWRDAYDADDLLRICEAQGAPAEGAAQGQGPPLLAFP